MKKFFLGTSFFFMIVATILISVNFQNKAQFWIFGSKNGSLAEAFFLLFGLGIVTGFLLGIALVYKKSQNPGDDY